MSALRPRLPVIFRAEARGDFKDSVTAVFPTLPGTRDQTTFTVYGHVGQHSTGTYQWYVETRAATPGEYADLLRELKSIYCREDDPEAVELHICKRFVQRHDSARRAALKEQCQ